jgi:alpha-amylase
MGTREQLASLINTCRSKGVRIYVDVVLNHFSVAGNDVQDHRSDTINNKCTEWGPRTSSAPHERQSPFFTHNSTFENNFNTKNPPSNEFPGAAIGPKHFHCTRLVSPNSSSLFELNNGWISFLTDLDTSQDYVRERQAAYLVELLSLGVSGFNINYANYMSPEDLAELLAKVRAKMGGQLPEDFIAWLDIIPGKSNADLWSKTEGYSTHIDELLNQKLGFSQDEINKIKM